MSLRPGGVYALTGEPASHKTTLAVQVSNAAAAQDRRVMMLLNEQSPRDLLRLAKRVTGANGRSGPALGIESFRRFQGPDDILRIVNSGRIEPPDLLVIDSLQGNGLASTATASYREFYRVLDELKRRGITTLTLLQTTKSGRMAGPRSLEHKVDVCLFLRKTASLRQFFIPKNRFGPEIVEPVMLAVTPKGLVPSPHALATTASVLAVVGAEIVEVQVSVSLPRLGCRGEVNAPFLGTRRVRQVFATINQLPGIDLNELTYAVNAFVPDTPSYSPAMDLPLAVAALSAYLQQAIPPTALFVGGLDLRRNIRPPTPPVIEALAHLLGYGEASFIKRVYVSSATADRLTQEVAQYAGDGDQPDVVGVRTLDELVRQLWPTVFPE
jgi:DNA repair protein RadA/Sms